MDTAMTYRSCRFGPMLILLTALAAPTAKAALIVAGPTDLPGTAIQDITLLPNTPFNPSASAVLIKDVSGVGTITINRDAQGGTTINIPTLAGGMYFGS